MKKFTTKRVIAIRGKQFKEEHNKVKGELKMDKEKTKEKIIQYLQEKKIIQFGEFTLASGAKSSFYIDLRLLPSYPKIFQKVNEMAAKIEALGYEKVRVRSSVTCESRRGICAKCYGMDLSTGSLVEEGMEPADRQGRFLAATLEVAEEKMRALEAAGFEATTGMDQLASETKNLGDEVALAWAEATAPVFEAISLAPQCYKREIFGAEDLGKTACRYEGFYYLGIGDFSKSHHCSRKP